MRSLSSQSAVYSPRSVSRAKLERRQPGIDPRLAVVSTEVEIAGHGVDERAVVWPWPGTITLAGIGVTTVVSTVRWPLRIEPISMNGVPPLNSRSPQNRPPLGAATRGCRSWCAPAG